jgi:hypothetical protein
MCWGALAAKICRRNSDLFFITCRDVQPLRFWRWNQPCSGIALNPYKQAIYLHGGAIKSALVHHGIGAMKGALNNEFQMRLNMNTNLKVALSTVALAALVAAPAVAKSHTQHHSNIYLNDAVVENGRVVGADPDSRVRFQIRRDYNWYRLD